MIEEEVQTHAPSHTHSYTHIHVCVCMHTDKLNGKLVREAGEQTLLAGSLWALASRNHVVVLIKKLLVYLLAIILSSSGMWVT